MDGGTPKPFRKGSPDHSRAIGKEKILFLCVPWRTPHRIVYVHSVVGPGTYNSIPKRRPNNRLLPPCTGVEFVR
jgi:hypothetical protein